MKGGYESVFKKLTFGRKPTELQRKISRISRINIKSYGRHDFPGAQFFKCITNNININNYSINMKIS